MTLLHCYLVANVIFIGVKNEEVKEYVIYSVKQIHKYLPIDDDTIFPNILNLKLCDA